MVSFTETPPPFHKVDGEGLSGRRLLLLPAIIFPQAGIATGMEPASIST